MDNSSHSQYNPNSQYPGPYYSQPPNEPTSQQQDIDLPWSPNDEDFFDYSAACDDLCATSPSTYSYDRPVMDHKDTHQEAYHPQGYQLFPQQGTREDGGQVFGAPQNVLNGLSGQHGAIAPGTSQQLGLGMPASAFAPVQGHPASIQDMGGHMLPGPSTYSHGVTALGSPMSYQSTQAPTKGEVSHSRLEFIQIGEGKCDFTSKNNVPCKRSAPIQVLKDDNKIQCCRCTAKHLVQWRREHAKVPEFELRIKSLKEARGEIYPPHPGFPRKHEDETLAQERGKQDEWQGRFLAAALMPYDENQMPKPNESQKLKEHHKLKEQQKVFNGNVECDDQGHYSEDQVNSRIALLFHIALAVHVGGSREYAIFGDNDGYPRESPLLKFRERLEKIEAYLRENKRIVLDVLQGRGVIAFVENPVAYGKRKSTNNAGNDDKKSRGRGRGDDDDDEDGEGGGGFGGGGGGGGPDDDNDNDGEYGRPAKRLRRSGTGKSSHAKAAMSESVDEASTQVHGNGQPSSWTSDGMTFDMPPISSDDMTGVAGGNCTGPEPHTSGPPPTAYQDMPGFHGSDHDVPVSHASAPLPPTMPYTASDLHFDRDFVQDSKQQLSHAQDQAAMPQQQCGSPSSLPRSQSVRPANQFPNAGALQTSEEMLHPALRVQHPLGVTHEQYQQAQLGQSSYFGSQQRAPPRSNGLVPTPYYTIMDQKGPVARPSMSLPTPDLTPEWPRTPQAITGEELGKLKNGALRPRPDDGHRTAAVDQQKQSNSYDLDGLLASFVDIDDLPVGHTRVYWACGSAWICDEYRLLGRHGPCCSEADA